MGKGRLDHIARDFDSPTTSEEHSFLRDTAWMGGEEVEARYILGMLLSENFFRLPSDAFIDALRGFLAVTVSQQTASTFAARVSFYCIIPFLRFRYHLEGDNIELPNRNDRVERAVSFLVHNLTSSNLEIASHIGTTEKQVARIQEVNAVRREINRYSH